MCLKNKNTPMTAIDTNYKSFVETIKTMVSKAQYEALKKVNKELIELSGI